ncbi:MAG: DEAD/DEAH box helicase family protein [Proteobacteria bacterium]|nr:DEAD/DEAH box helicase family protein [Pseudomonadota bacterium]MBS0494231.1 DEAD/DEAH box helicase family protein [Pseudomonadota bacterium]
MADAKTPPIRAARASSNAPSRQTKPRGKKSKAAPPPLHRQRCPEGMDAAEWQRGLRRQFGQVQAFELESLGPGPVLGDWGVVNPGGQSSYRVAIRGLQPGDNFCTCADYATNGLGTCKHIEFALHRLLRKRGARAAFKAGWQPEESEIWLRYGEQRTLCFTPGHDCPPALLTWAGRHFDLTQGGAWREAGAPWAFDRLLRQARRLAGKLGHGLQVHEDVLAFVARARDARHRAQVLDQAYPRGARDKGLGKLLTTRLYPYQVEGALFAARAGRVLIGDDMGLGKTVQAIAAAELMARHFGVRRVLVVCPTSLKHQWQAEFQRFAGREAQVLQGLRPARQAQWREDAFCKIANYETLVRDADLASGWAPELLIVDEAQRVKNWNTQAARAIKRVADPGLCPNVVVLTGTPLENRLEELLSIVQVVDQHSLGATWRLLHEHQQTDESGRVVGYRDLHRIGERLAPILLRRRKSEVLTQLPERVDKTLFVPLTPEQRLHHDENGQIVTRIVQRWRQTGYLSDIDQRRLQCALQNMRMVCNSTWLLDHETDHGGKADELMAVLDEILEDPQAKAVVFSQWLGTHEVLMRRLAARGWGHVFFHGSVPAEQRGALVQRFHEDEGCRLFLSTDAGSAGLNLQHAAAVVVNMDQPWNPALLEQRIGRVHRMGQRRGVQVVNLVAEASIEQGMLSLLSFKRALFDGVLDGGDSEVFMAGSRLSRFMETVDKATEGAAASASTPEPESEPAPQDETASAQPGPADVGPQGDMAATETDWMSDPPAPAPGPAPDVSPPSQESAAAAPAAGDPWAPLLQAGLQWLESMAAPPADTPAGGQPRPASAVRTDPATGERYLHLPLPDPAALRKLADRLAEVLRSHAP